MLTRAEILQSKKWSTFRNGNLCFSTFKMMVNTLLITKFRLCPTLNTALCWEMKQSMWTHFPCCVYLNTQLSTKILGHRARLHCMKELNCATSWDDKSCQCSVHLEGFVRLISASVSAATNQIKAQSKEHRLFGSTAPTKCKSSSHIEK